MQPIGALVFDMDNTLVETEHLNARLVAEAFEDAFDVRLGDEERSLIIGRTWESTFDDLCRIHGVSGDHRILERRVIDAKNAWMKANRLRPAAGLAQLLEVPVPKVVVSGSITEEIIAILEHLGVRGAFSAVFGADAYARSKPAPDGFLLAAKYLGLPKAELLVIEDSASGVAAAKAAGIRVMFVREFAVQDVSADADHAVDTLYDVADMLASGDR